VRQAAVVADAGPNPSAAGRILPTSRCKPTIMVLPDRLSWTPRPGTFGTGMILSLRVAVIHCRTSGLESKPTIAPPATATEPVTTATVAPVESLSNSLVARAAALFAESRDGRTK